MNPILLYCLSGDSLYLGAAILLLAVLISSLIPWLIARNIVAWLGLILIIMAAPPFSWTAICVFGLAFILWYYVWNRPGTSTTLRVGAEVVLSVLLVAAVSVEYPHRRLAKLTGIGDDHIVVIGDSISAGLDPKVSWPTLLQQREGIRSRNLSRVGATARDAIQMATQVSTDDRLVLIEIGGNDMIAGVPAAEFGQSLKTLLKNLQSPGRTIVMMELPLLPYRLGYGQLQRKLASEYGVQLIPKRFFVEVIGGANATSDGLHLTVEGARRMAFLIARVFAPVLKVAPARC